MTPLLLHGQDIAAHLIAEAARIERDKRGRALTQAEADTLKAVQFLRTIAPYLFEGDREP